MNHSEEWVIWNGSMGILDMVTIGPIENDRSAFLAPPYAIVGRFNLDELEAEGCIAFGECLVMSRQRWQEDQVTLRVAAREKRRAFLLKMEIRDNSEEYREMLCLPIEGTLTRSEISAAFRKLAKTAHPDAGGSDENYRRIVQARDALLELFESP